MGVYHFTESEEKFANLIWENEPLGSGELVKLSEKEMEWKKSTTYTVLKKLCEKGIFINEDTIVRSKMTREQYKAQKSIRFVEEMFEGSLPKFLTAFMTGKKISKKQYGELKRMIEEYKEDDYE